MRLSGVHLNGELVRRWRCTCGALIPERRPADLKPAKIKWLPTGKAGSLRTVVPRQSSNSL